MHIISKFKDYYDYVAGPEPDRRVVYVRHCQAYRERPDAPGSFALVGPHSPDPASRFGPLPAIYRVHFCGLTYPVGVNTNGFDYDGWEVRHHFDPSGLLQYSPARGWYRPDSVKPGEPAPTTINEVLNAPVVFQLEDVWLANSQLSAIEFGKRFAAEDAFMAIYNFLVPKEVPPDVNPTNLTRFEAKGFDKKVSFRKRQGG